MVVWSCFNRCSLSTLYPDGVVRCDLDSSFATELCNQIVSGRTKLQEPTTARVEIVKPLRVKPIQVKVVKPKVIKPRTIKIKKSKTAQGNLF